MIKGIAFCAIITLLIGCERSQKAPLPEKFDVHGHYAEVTERLYVNRVDDLERNVTCWVFRDIYKEGVGVTCMPLNRDAGAK